MGEQVDDWTSFTTNLSASASGSSASGTASETGSYSKTGGGAPGMSATIVFDGSSQMTVSGHAQSAARTMAWMVVEVVDGPVAYSFQATAGGSGASGVASADAHANFSRVEGKRPYPHIEEITPEAKLAVNPSVQKNGVLEPAFYILQADAWASNPSCYPAPDGCPPSAGDANVSVTLTLGGS